MKNISFGESKYKEIMQQYGVFAAVKVGTKKWAVMYKDKSFKSKIMNFDEKGAMITG